MAEQTRDGLSPEARRDRARELRGQGMTLAAIGLEMGFSRQRASEILGKVGRLPRKPRAPRPISAERMAHADELCAFEGCPRQIDNTRMNIKFCPEHVGCYRRNWSEWTPERKAMNSRAAARWRAAHPEREREIVRAAQKRYYDRQRKAKRDRKLAELETER